MIPSSINDRIPTEPYCIAALDIARQHLEKPILYHSLRVYLIARWLSERDGTGSVSDADSPYLFVAAIFHDAGTCDLYNGEQRFEVEGADAAREHLRSHGISETDSHKVWVAIALHTSPGIAERIDPFTRLIRLAVKIDFSQDARDLHGATSFTRDLEADLPRLNIEEVLAEAVIRQARKIPETVDRLTWPSDEKHPSASWPGILLRAHIENPGHVGINPAF